MKIKSQGLHNRAGRFYFRLVPFALCLGIACAGCGTINPVTDEGSYLTYVHPFTDAAAQSVLQNAGRTCADRKRDAIKTDSVCSLTQCTTHYQCVVKGGGTGYEK